ncbi:tetratricopeptide repeat-containing serine protease family protein [Nostoc sp. NMS4]|uniref:tetratricopeptide repeat-containing S1 family peptidase n=1 Tax=Nostoc sp. NMS4 TaxID=2815390 RepID=UPI0025EB34DB|nr:tetratricopeptide repeat-containing serine protease family protein [Nostoc sp. NMS4]MBN3924745.1 serine protease [Nostoc sp. NMS4]
MPTGFETAIVRIRKSNGVVVGAGFLVSQNYVITCAHVVADALEISWDTQKRPTEVVYLDFPLIASEESLTGRVVFWRPVPPKGSTSVNGKEDIAGLELNGTVPKTAQPVDLIIEEDLRGHSFRTFGFPAGHDDGLEATGVIRGRQGTGWIQIEDIKETGVRLEPGFSGAPIWDQHLNGVVGMAVAADQKRPEAKVAFMIPIKVIATAWTELTIPPLILTPNKRFRYWRNRPWILASIALLPVLGGVFIVMQNHATPSNNYQCKTMSQTQETVNKIVIANFYNTGVDAKNILRTEDRLFEILKKDAQNADSVEVCLANETVHNPLEAQTLGKNLNATIVIWGGRDSILFEVKLEGIKEKIPYLNALSFPSSNASEYNLQTQDIPGLISVMTAFGLSMSYYLNHQIPKARDILTDALATADQRKLGKNNEENAERLAEAYYLLGSMFEVNIDDSNCAKTFEACQKALNAYEKASEYNVKPYQNLLNKGILYEKLKLPDKAIEAYKTIIDYEPESNSAVVARAYRADVLLSKGEKEEAIKDLDIVCQRKPANLEYRHFLGLAQLQTGRLEKAKETYQYVNIYVDSDKELKDEIIEDLNTLAKGTKNPDITKAIHEIISTL